MSTMLNIVEKRRGSDIDTLALAQANENDTNPLKRSRNELLCLPRTSALQAPTMLLTGHQASVTTVKYSYDGQWLLSAGFDKVVLIWTAFGQNDNIAVLTGHKNAITDACWSSDSAYVYTASADRRAFLYDMTTCRRIKTMSEHQSIITSIATDSSSTSSTHPSSTHPSFTSSSLLATASDDGTLKVWDMRQKRSSITIEESYQLLTVAWGGGDSGLSSANSGVIFTGGIEGNVSCYDLRQPSTPLLLLPHQHPVTCISLSADRSTLLSNCQDGFLRLWDVRAFNPSTRCQKALSGATHSPEQHVQRCWLSGDASSAGAGSADRHVYMWDCVTRQVTHRLPGHQGVVLCVDHHPTEAVIATGGADGRVFVGEL